jgi:hypothetical protein
MNEQIHVEQGNHAGFHLRNADKFSLLPDVLDHFGVHLPDAEFARAICSLIPDL